MSVLKSTTVSLMLMLAGLAATSYVSAQEQLPELDKQFIIGGQETQKGTYPWVVALTYASTGSLFDRQFCGASVIADKWVMTAAHCLYDSRSAKILPSDLNVAIGAENLADQDAVELQVTNIIIHPDYDHNANNPHSDIALLELATSSGITPIKVSTKATAELVGLDATVIGWGAVEYTDANNQLYPIWSHDVVVPIVSLDICNAPDSYANEILENQLCAGYAAGGRDSCVGDSGGPMIVTINGEIQQAGIVSFGYGCALPNYYGVYTDVPYFIGWINQYIFVGEPEYEPEQLNSRSSSSAASSSSDNNDVLLGGTSWFGMLLLGASLLLRRRSL